MSYSVLYAQSMTTIDELGHTIATTYDIDLAPARDMVTTYIDQINDDADLWNAEERTLTADGVEVVTSAIAEGYRQGLNSTTEDQMLAELEDNRAEVNRLDERRGELDVRRDELVRALLKTSVLRRRIAEAAGVKEARLYQIRDDRR